MKHWLIIIFATLTVGSQSIAQNDDTGHKFYETDKIERIKIKIPETNWSYLLDSLRVNGNRMLIANVEINEKKYSNAGIRWAASRSFRTGNTRNGIILKLNLINRKQNHEGYTTLRFSPALRDPSMVREVLSFEIARDYMPAPKANYADIDINDDKYGLFVNVQGVDESFLNQHFGSTEGSFFRGNPPVEAEEPKGCKKNIYCNLEYDEQANCYLHNYEILSDYGWGELIQLTKILNNDPEKIESILDVDNTLWMLAFNNVLVNLNSYSGAISENYFLYQDTLNKFNPIIWDLNFSFGSFKNTGKGSDLSLKGLQQLDPLLHENEPTKPLISQLLKNPLYKKIYLDHIRTILYSWFINDKYKDRAITLQSLIDSSFRKDPNKYYEVDEFESSLTRTIGKRSKIPGIVQLMEARSEYLKKHPTMSVIPPIFKTNIIKSRDAFDSKGVEDFRIQTEVSKFTKTVTIYYRFDSHAPYQYTIMKDDGKTFDEAPGDNIFGVVISPAEGQDSLEYFFLAENASAVNFDPPRYMFEPHRITLKALNK